MLRITLVDEYDFNNMILIDPIMARILCGAFLTLSAILLLNLLIALLSDTFQRVYDNAKGSDLLTQIMPYLSAVHSMTKSTDQ